MLQRAIEEAKALESRDRSEAGEVKPLAGTRAESDLKIWRRPAGFIIDVPVTLSVSVRGVPEAEAKRIARGIVESLEPSDQFIQGYVSSGELPAGTLITEVSLSSPSDESCEVLDELEADDEEDSM